MSAVHPVGGEALTSKVSSALHHVWDAIHPHSTGGAKVLEPCALATEVLSRVKAEMPEWGPAEEEFVDAACLQRYLRARGKDVGKASAMLKHTLEWRREFGVDKLRLSDYDSFLAEGWIYLLGNDDAGHSVMMLRKRASRLEDDRQENFLGFLVLTLESSIRMMKHGQETWTWLLDMSNYDSRNSPRFDFTVRVLQLVANHYPERLNKVFIVDAPTLFWVLFKALCPFLDPVTKAKVEFVYSKDVKAAAAPAAPADSATARFMPFYRFWATPYDRQANDELLRSLGWPQ